jgi:hypothetical protein
MNHNLYTASGSIPGLSSLYPTGSYTIQVQGTGTFAIAGDASSLASTSAYIAVNPVTGIATSTLPSGQTATCTFTVGSATNNGIYWFQYTTDTLSVGNYLKPQYIGLTSNYAAWQSGTIFNPIFISALQQMNLKCLRFMDWFNTPQQFVSSYTEDYGNTGLTGTPSSGATTVTLASALSLPGGSNWKLSLSNGQDITNCSFTTGGTTVTLGQSVNSATFQAGNWLGISMIKSWSDRPLMSNCFWSTAKGVPIEVAIALCNEIGCAGWFNIPVSADNTYISGMLNLINTNLTSGLTPYIEFSNENWNSAGPQVNMYRYCAYNGQAMFTANASDQYDCLLNWAGSRTAYIGDTAYAISSRFVVSMGGQISNPYVYAQSATAPFWVALGNTAPYTHHLNGCHISIYLGQSALSSGDFTAFNSQSDGGVNYFTQSMTTNVITGGTAPGTYSDIPSNGWIGQAVGYVSQQLSDSTFQMIGQPLRLYEIGQSLQVGGSQAAFATLVNRNALMGTAYTSMFQQISALGVQLACVFDFCYEGSGNGYNWGCYENIGQYSATVTSLPPKAQAVVNFNL